MAEVTGPISSLPGHREYPPKGTMCDDHPDREAVVRLQGETDSFGCEMHDLCRECADEAKNVEPHIGKCDWCDAPDQRLGPRRDMDEGLSGRVYYVCSACVAADNKAINDELNEYADYWEDDYD
jgi:hypothetical protein